MAGNASKPGVSVASRTLALLGAFDAAHRRLSLTDMARRADLPVPTAYRLVNELQRWGALTRTSSGDYVIGRRLWDVGLLAPMQTGLREVASPFLHDLYGATLATVHLAVREGTNALYIERLSGHASVPVVSKIGTRLPMHATGVGKVLLAHAPEAIRTEVLAHLTRLTAHTVIHGGVLRNQLSRVHRDGYATTVEEMTLGACSVAVPVYRGDDVVAALGVVVPSLNRDKLRLVSALNVAAQGISRSLS
ncbi:IclR family transcriptional regulator [Mycobacterium avium subsp. hominissuis]|uniref:Glycerol operon regulatory protein n=1 Tax=Mycobacterium avium TaxID=1764 RepID=A0A2A2ZN71_MYCAV|nr:IclR family transcriptional regulator [Mycobacterium avium]MDO2384359.1 IclR family transcriptional regulator [Mycobacterium avium subsp. hominissuis]MDO2395899.1 IclR family transcriptional regulator [Mycobacterium avium subsp. hominissuis]PBA27934.1 IclR family transcriptional regulator [Mycobacterium avium]